MKKPLFASIAAAAFAAIAAPASAETLIGSQVTLTLYYPSLGNVASIPNTQTVANGIEYPSGSLQALSGLSIVGQDIDVGASSINIQFLQGGTFLPVPFDGDVYSFDSSAPLITGLSLDPLSTLSSSDLGLDFGPHSVTVNIKALTIGPSDRILLDLSLAPAAAAAPEPDAYLLALAGFAAIRLAARHKARACPLAARKA